MLRVEEAMTFRAGDRLPVFSEKMTARDVLAGGERSDCRSGPVLDNLKRRSGALLLVDEQGRLSGIFTDGDLRRQVLKDQSGGFLGLPIKEIMVRDPERVEVGELASRALAIMNQYRIDELPVVDAAGRPVGLLDVQDMVGLKALSHGED